MNLKESKFIRNITIIINAIFSLIFPISIAGAMVSPMAFDAPGSTENFYTWVFFWTTLSLPIVIFISIVTSLLLLFIYKSYKKAFLFSLLPIINFAVIFSCFLIETIQRSNFNIK